MRSAPPSNAPSACTTVLAHTEPDRWRDQARALLRAGLRPESIRWLDPAQPQAPLAFTPQASHAAPAAPASADTPSALSVPRRFLDLARLVLAHSDESRFEVLYRVLWRIAARGERRLLENAIDADTARLSAWAKAVRRDMHKMKAFVRFRRVDDPAVPESPRYIAFHRPDFDIADLVAPFFVRRFGVMRWTIMTPRRTLDWDGQTLRTGPGAPSRSAPAGDDLEEFWKTYYASVFNPARANPRAMIKELPKRHWATLPEASIIDELLRSAARRTGGMIDAAPASGRSAADFLPPQKPAPLHVLQKAAECCKGCDLYKNATQTVFGVGPADARIMLVGEQPGNDEDLAGQPFVGPAGKLLDKALAEAGLDRAKLYVTNAVKHFKWTPAPRGKMRIHAKPTVRETVACRAWLEQEIGAVRPGVIVLLGATAAQSLLGAAFRITKSRGQPIRTTQWAPTLIATYHPSAVLRTPDPDMKAQQYADLVSDLRLAKASAE